MGTVLSERYELDLYIRFTLILVLKKLRNFVATSCVFDVLELVNTDSSQTYFKSIKRTKLSQQISGRPKSGKSHGLQKFSVCNVKKSFQMPPHALY